MHVQTSRHSIKSSILLECHSLARLLPHFPSPHVDYQHWIVVVSWRMLTVGLLTQALQLKQWLVKTVVIIL